VGAVQQRPPLEPIGAVHKAPTDLGEEEAHKLIGQLMENEHFEQLLDETGTFYKPNGEVLAILLRNCLPKDLCERARPIIRKAALRQTIAGGNRGTAAGTGMVPRIRKNGSKAKISGVPTLRNLSQEDYRRLKNASDGLFGYTGRGIRGGQVYPCRQTVYKGALPREFRQMMEFVYALELGWRFAASHNSQVSARLLAQAKTMCKTPSSFVLRLPKKTTKSGVWHTAFTTVTCNRNWRTAAHKDKGDFKNGLGVMASLGQFDGCDLVFPRYKAAVRYREGDILLADVHEVHGNTPLLNPDGSIPTLDNEPERLVTVLYYQENMHRCLGSLEEEQESVNKRKRGDPVYA